MSWISSRTPQELIDEATSEKHAGGEQNLALNLDITDMVRSKVFPADQAAKVVRKKLYSVSADVQLLTLHLLDLLIKNGGPHFVDEINSKEFVDAYVAQALALRNQNRNPEVMELMLEYLQSWAAMFEGKSGSQIIRGYNQLQNTPGITFPERTSVRVAPSFLHTETAPTWVDSDTCMKSGQAFSMFNRKHHCRNCGGVFLQEFCSDFDPLPQFGIMVPVRVCVDCHAKLAARQGSKSSNQEWTTAKKRNVQLQSNDKVWGETSFDKDLHRALELSKGNAAYLDKSLPPTVKNRQSNRHNSKKHSEPQVEEMDEDMRAAIAASLADMEDLKQRSGATASVGQVNQPQGSVSVEAQQNQRQEAQNQAQQRRMRNHLVTEQEFNGVRELQNILRTAQPHDAVYDPKLLELNRLAQTIQPKLVRELTTTTDKLQLLEDLHGRMMSLSGYYDRLLDQELRGHQGQISLPSEPQSQPQPQQRQYAIAEHVSAPRRPAYGSQLNLAVSAPPAPHVSVESRMSALPSAPLRPPETESPDLEPEQKPEPVLIEF